MDLKKQNDILSKVPLTQSEFIPFGQSTNQTAKLNEQSTQKEKYANVKNLSAIGDKKPLESIDVLAQTSSIGPFPFESNISTNEASKTQTKNEKENLSSTQQNANISSTNTQNNTQNLDFNYNFDNLEEYKTGQNTNDNIDYTKGITYTENILPTSGANKNDYLTNDDFVNLGLDFGTKSDNNTNKNIEQNYVNVNNLVYNDNNNVNTNYFDTTRIDKKSYSEKITIPEFGEFTFDDNLNLKQISKTNTGINITENTSTNITNQKVEPSSNTQNNYVNENSTTNNYNINDLLQNTSPFSTDMNYFENSTTTTTITKKIETPEVQTQINSQMTPLTNNKNEEVKPIPSIPSVETGLKLEPMTNIINQTTNYESGLNTIEYQQTNNNLESTSPFQSGLFLKSIRNITTKDSATQTTKSLIATTTPDESSGNIDQFISSKPIMETFEPENPLYSYSTQELISPSENKFTNIFKPQNITTTNTTTTVTSLENKNQEIYKPQEITTTNESITNTITSNTMIPTTTSYSFENITSSSKKKTVPTDEISNNKNYYDFGLNEILNKNTYEIKSLPITTNAQPVEETTTTNIPLKSQNLIESITDPYSVIDNIPLTKTQISDIPTNISSLETKKQDENINIQGLISTVETTFPATKTEITNVTSYPETQKQTYSITDISPLTQTSAKNDYTDLFSLENLSKTPITVKTETQAPITTTISSDILTQNKNTYDYQFTKSNENIHTSFPFTENPITTTTTSTTTISPNIFPLETKNETKTQTTYISPTINTSSSITDILNQANITNLPPKTTVLPTIVHPTITTSVESTENQNQTSVITDLPKDLFSPSSIPTVNLSKSMEFPTQTITANINTSDNQTKTTFLPPIIHPPITTTTSPSPTTTIPSSSIPFESQNQNIDNIINNEFHTSLPITENSITNITSNTFPFESNTKTQTTYLPPIVNTSLPITENPITNISTDLFPFESKTQNNTISSFIQTNPTTNISTDIFPYKSLNNEITNNQESTTILPYEIRSHTSNILNSLDNNFNFSQQNYSTYQSTSAPNIPSHYRTESEIVPVEEVEYVPVKKLKYVKKTKVFVPKVKKVIVPVKKKIIIPVKKTIYISRSSSVPPQSSYNYSQTFQSPNILPYSTQTEIDNEMEEAAVPIPQSEKNYNEPVQIQSFTSYNSAISQVPSVVSQVPTIPQVPTLSQVPTVSQVPTTSQTPIVSQVPAISQIPPISQLQAPLNSLNASTASSGYNRPSSPLSRYISGNIYNPRTYKARSLSSRRY